MILDREKALRFLKEQRKLMNYMNSTLSVVSWDTEVMAPEEAIDYRSEVIGYLSSNYHQLTTDYRIEQALGVLLSEEDKFNLYEQRLIEEFYDIYYKNKKIPESLQKELSMATAISNKSWKRAKEKGDYELFKPHLARVIDLLKQQAVCVGYEGHIYNAFLDNFEKGMTVEELDEIFADLKEGLVKLLAELKEAKQLSFRRPKGPFSKESQSQLALYILNQMGYRIHEAGRLDETEHPFTAFLGPKDIRITTHYYENSIEGALFSTIHEGGHAIYDQNMPHDWAEYGVNEAPSMGLHESQSRFYENIIGRSLPFWRAYFPKLQEFMPSYQSVSLEEFYQMINEVSPSLIRTEADEITYSLHIIIRYEIEKLMVSGEVGIDELPMIWNQKYKEYLGVEPRNDAEGLMQDVHWAEGMIGYFPSYALGNLYGAQFYHQMKKELPQLKDEIESGNLSIVFEWLKQNVHSYGKVYTPGQLVEHVTKEPLNPKYFLDYLREKYLNLYHL